MGGYEAELQQQEAQVVEGWDFDDRLDARELRAIDVVRGVVVPLVPGHLGGIGVAAASRRRNVSVHAWETGGHDEAPPWEQSIEQVSRRW